MVDGGNGMKYSFYESLSPLFRYHEDMAIYIGKFLSTLACSYSHGVYLMIQDVSDPTKSMYMEYMFILEYLR